MKNELIKIFRLAIKSRKLQFKINELLKENEFKIPIHLAFGHEFVASVVKFFFKKNDQILLTHRNIHFNSIFSKDILSKYKKLTTQNNQNHLSFEGSMNFVDRHSNIIYSSSILGNNLPVACGVAKSFKKKNSITICVTGDGAIEEGTFYESLTLSKYLKLPIIFLIENNNWSMASTIKQRRTVINLKHLAKSINIEYYRFSKFNFINNINKYSKAVNYCRKNNTPVICEFDVKTLGTYFLKNKTIHYHHGPMKLKSHDIIVGRPNEDALYHLRKEIKKYESY